MHVEKTEINGFLIDNFNQYGLKEGDTQGICPLCSSERKPKNRKKQCASYDWERGLGTCLLYTSPSPRDATLSRMPSSA